MKITEIETRLLRVDASQRWHPSPRPVGARAEWEYPLVTIRTDEGIEGHTMAYGPHGDGAALVHRIHSLYAPHLLGADPLRPREVWRRLRSATRHFYNDTETLVGVLDVGLWDIVGKAAGLPLWRLLGGAREQVPCYQSVQRFQLPSEEAVAEQVHAIKGAGFAGMKLQLGLDADADIPLLERARREAGDGFPLMLDAVGGYTVADARRVGSVLDDLAYEWFEEPISDHHAAQLAALGERLRTPLAIGETLSLGAAGELLRSSVAPIVRGDVNIKAGVTGLVELCAAAALSGATVEIHTAATPLLDLANLHVACGTGSGRYAEAHHPVFDFGLRGGFSAQGGMLTAPSGPGLGAQLDDAWIDAATVEAPRVSTSAESPVG